MKEALKLALEALKTASTEIGTKQFEIEEEAIIAIKEALAQSAQEPWCMKMNGCKTKCEDCPDEPAQGPFAVLFQDGSFVKYENLEFVPEKSGQSVQIIYITPQQRPWVGLTDEQIDELSCKMVKGNKSVNWLCRAIEAKLKEKNK